jgi:circadian clock protein KaiB
VNDKPPADVTAAFEQAVTENDVDRYSLRLYVTGMTPRSLRAIENIKRVCEQSLKDRYSLEVVDIYQHPELASSAQIIAAPTLIKDLPLPLRRIIGDLSDHEKVLVGLDLNKQQVAQ